MRVYKDLDLVEHLGSGVPRILESYPKECFMFSENFLRMSFPAAKTITPQVMELVKVMKDEMSRQEIQDKIGLSDRKNFRTNYLNLALEFGVIEMSLPAKPNSRLQEYKLTLLGKNLKN